MTAPSLFRSSPPDVAIEIAPSHVAAARVSWRGGVASIAAHAVEPLPPGAVVPALAAPNVVDAGALKHGIAQVVAQLGSRPRRVAMVLPDTVAKVSLVRFETVPPRAGDLQELVRWQIRKSAPFPLEQAVVSYAPGVTPPEGGQEFVVTVARADIVASYEEVAAQAGLHAGLIDIATFSIVNSVLAGPEEPAGDWLLVHAASNYTTLTVLRGPDPMFFRNRAEGAEGTLADVVHQTAMYYEDRLKGAGFSRVMLAASAVAPDDVDRLRRGLEERLAVRVQAIDRTAHAPLVGILLRERKAA